MLIRFHDLMGVWCSSINPRSSEDYIFQTLLPTFERTLLFIWTVMSDSLQPCGQQHATLPCPSSSPRACWNSCPLSWWCHSAISFSVFPFFSRFQSFPPSGSLLMSRLFTSRDQSSGASASTSTLQWIFRIDLIFLLSRGLSKSLLQNHNSKASVLQHSAFFMDQLSHP